MQKNTVKTLMEIESEIIEWAKLISNCKPDSTRFEQRVDSIERLIQVKRGLEKLISPLG